MLKQLGSKHTPLVEFDKEFHFVTVNFDNGVRVEVWGQTAGDGFTWRFTMADKKNTLKVEVRSSRATRLSNEWPTVEKMAKGELTMTAYL